MTQPADQYFDGTRTFDSLSSPKLGIQSLYQLQSLYNSRSPHEIAQNVVYGVKPKPQYSRNQPRREYSVRSNQSEENTISKCVSPSKLTLLSQQLFGQVANKLENAKSQRAFYQKDDNILLSPQRLKSMPSPQNRPMTDVTNRLIEFKDVLETKKEKLNEKVFQEKMAECTFQPAIDANSRNMVMKSAQQIMRSADEFQEDQMRYVKAYQTKKEKLAEQKIQDEELELQAAPKISSKTEKLAQNRIGNSPVVERLYCLSPKRSQATLTQVSEPAHPFHPEISFKSKTMKRDKPVELFLYEDAQVRKEKEKMQMMQSTQTTSSTQLSESSIGWFVQRFIKEFYFQLSCLDRIKTSEQKDYSRLTYSETLQVLQGLHYFKTVQYGQLDEDQRHILALLWQHLAPQDPPATSVLSRNLLVVLLAILAVPVSHTAIPQYKPHQLHEEDSAGIGESDLLFQQSRADFLQPDEEGVKNISKPRRPQRIIPHDEHGNLKVSSQEAQYLHQTFHTLYLNTKQLSVGNGKRRQLARSPDRTERLYSPQISSNSHQLSMNKRAQIMGGERDFNINDWFNIQDEIKIQKREALKQQVLEAEMKECTFGKQTQTCSINLHELARPVPKQHDRKPQDIEFERQQEECTFAPKISDPKSNSQMISSKFDSVRSQINKTADRMREARVRKEALQQMKEKGITTNIKSRGELKRSAQIKENSVKPQKKRGLKSQPMKKAKTETSEQNREEYEIPMAQQRFSRDRADDEKVPLLFVDVNIEEGKTARIVVFEGDQSEELAEKFSQEYNLDESMKMKLKELLDLQINSLLTKIDEDFQEESDKDTFE